ncbi:MAG: peptidoglycan DD-metalloendopeptidase family protein [Bacteroidales bacterium]|nr:peptidoglycan DD-metalloendopeptidase family protein [Bacteroidales bacterium]
MKRVAPHFLPLLLTALLLMSSGAYCQSKNELQKEKARIEAEIKKLDKQLSKAKQDTRLNKNQLAALNKKINERNKLIKNINQQMGLLNQQILQKQDSSRVMRSHVDSLKREYAKVIQVLYREKDKLSPASLIFDTPNYNVAFLRQKYYSDYSRYRKHQAAFIRQRQQELDALTLRLQAQKNEKSNLLSQEQRQKARLDKDKKQAQNNIRVAQADEKQLKQQISKKQQEKRALEQQIQRLVAEEVAKANRARKNTGKTMTSTTRGASSEKTSSSTPAAVPNANEAALNSDFVKHKGRLSWPVYYKSVIREFGRYKHESGGENMSNGIELSTAPGAPVYAVFKGTATRVFTCPNGTKGIIIRHGEYMSVYANLATTSVKEGAEVETKQTIGTVYANGTSTGDFNFQIWNGTTPVNPRTFLR